jgi:hypothetical protein
VVGIPGVAITAHDILVEVNQSSPSLIRGSAVPGSGFRQHLWHGCAQ